MCAALNVDKFGRRKLFLTSCIGMLLCYAIIMGLSASFASNKNSATGAAVYVMKGAIRANMQYSVPFYLLCILLDRLHPSTGGICSRDLAVL
jgi:MFS family permease